jgi:hypothetical protein
MSLSKLTKRLVRRRSVKSTLAQIEVWRVKKSIFSAPRVCEGVAVMRLSAHSGSLLPLLISPWGLALGDVRAFRGRLKQIVSQGIEARSTLGCVV